MLLGIALGVEATFFPPANWRGLMRLNYGSAFTVFDFDCCVPPVVVAQVCRCTPSKR